MKLTIRTDGGSRGNPGPAAAGVFIENEKGQAVFSGGFFLGRATNNVAEYNGIILGLQYAIKLGGTHITLFCDSELVVKQIKREYRVKNADMKVLFDKAITLIDQLEGFTIQHVYRSDNSAADSLVNESLDCQSDVGGFLATDHAETTPITIDPILLNEKIHHSASGMHCERIIDNKSIIVELVSLDHNQAYPINTGSHTTLQVLEGSGSIITDDTETLIINGTLIYLDGSLAINLTANNDEAFSILITTVK